MPAAMSFAIISSESEAGPIVQTIFVRRSIILLMAAPYRACIRSRSLLGIQSRLQPFQRRGHFGRVGSDSFGFFGGSYGFFDVPHLLIG